MAVKLKQSSALGSLSLTPLIDVVFLLLIFFLVVTRFAEEDRELEVELPSASEAMPLIAEPKEMFVNIDQHGNYFVGGKTLTLDELEAAMERAVRNNPTNQDVIIRADRRTQHGPVVDVMNLCNRTGVADYKLATGHDD